MPKSLIRPAAESRTGHVRIRSAQHVPEQPSKVYGNAGFLSLSPTRRLTRHEPGHKPSLVSDTEKF